MEHQCRPRAVAAADSSATIFYRTPVPPVPVGTTPSSAFRYSSDEFPTKEHAFAAPVLTRFINRRLVPDEGHVFQRVENSKTQICSDTITALMFAGDLTTPDYSRQLTAIAQVLNRPSMPVWVVSLISAGLGAAAGVLAEPLKTRVKLWADIHDLRKELRRALVRQEALMDALNRRIRSECINHEQLHSVHILKQVSTSAITYLLEYKKELLMREGLYEWGSKRSRSLGPGEDSSSGPNGGSRRA
jgi:hypothetical protein